LERIVKTIRFPKELIEEVNQVSSWKNMNFTDFVTDAIKNYLREIRFTEAVSESSGVWELQKHPELKDGTEEFIKSLRRGRDL
jgi:metal-responsive CopG/Arc/MetJ family transcriptional regulator